MTPTPFTKSPLLFNAKTIRKEFGAYTSSLLAQKSIPSEWDSLDIQEEDLLEGSYLSYVMGYFPHEKVGVKLNKKGSRNFSPDTISIIIPLESSPQQVVPGEASHSMKSGECWHIVLDEDSRSFTIPGQYLHIELSPSAWTDEFLALSKRYTSQMKNVILSPSLPQRDTNKAAFNRIFGLFSGKVGVNS